MLAAKLLNEFDVQLARCFHLNPPRMNDRTMGNLPQRHGSVKRQRSREASQQVMN
jgi:hypothetical protein